MIRSGEQHPRHPLTFKPFIMNPFEAFTDFELRAVYESGDGVFSDPLPDADVNREPVAIGIYVTEKEGDGLQYHLHDIEGRELAYLRQFVLDQHFRKKYPNGIQGWLDTYYHISTDIGQIKKMWSPRLDRLHKRLQGSPGWRDLAEELTDEFELINKDRFWDGEFYEEVDDFVSRKINKMLQEV